MKVPIRIPLNRNNNSEEKNDYANFNHTRIITLLQIPQYEHLQILICNGNSLTTLAGIEHVKHLWKLDVGNNQIRSLQHLSRFLALGSLILSNNNLTWIEFQHIRHMFILDSRTDGNPVLDADPNYRQHVLDCLPRVWMCDGVFVSTVERNQVDEFFTQSSFTQKPVRRKLVRDAFMPTNLKDRSVNGLFGSKATELLAKFPTNCFINAELDKRRIKHLASTFQDLLLTEMKYEDAKKHDEFLTENRHNLYHMIDLRPTHTEEFNMLLILLLTDILYKIPGDLLDNIMDITHIKTIENLNIAHIFSSNEHLKCMIASLVYAGARVDRDENHPSAFYDKLFNSLSIVLNNQMRHFPSSNTNQTHQNNAVIAEAKAMVCLEVMQVFIMCPVFYTLIDDYNVNAILRQALGRSPAYGSIRDVLQSFVADQKTAEEQKDLLSPILGNILKMTIRTLSTKRMKKSKQPVSTADETMVLDNEHLNQREREQKAPSPTSPKRASTNHVPSIGDRILTAPQSFGRIVTLPDAELAMIQLDHVLTVHGAMSSSGSSTDHTNYVHMKDFDWDLSHEYWKPKFALGDKITLHMTTIRSETPRLTPSPVRTPPPPPPPPHPPKIARSKTPDSIGRECVTPKVFEIDFKRPKSRETFVNLSREMTPQSLLIPTPASNDDTIDSARESPRSLPPTPPTVKRSISLDRPMSVRLIKQKQEQPVKSHVKGEPTSSSPVLTESTLLLLPHRLQISAASFDQIQQQQPTNSSANINDSGPVRMTSTPDYSSMIPPTSVSHPRSATHRVPVPVHNASQWFDGPDMKNERTERMEQVVTSIVRRSFRPSFTYGMPRVPTLTSPSSRDHAQYKGVRPGSFHDFCIESHRMTPTPSVTMPKTPSYKKRSTPSIRMSEMIRTSHTSSTVNRVKSLLNPPCPSPAWL